MNIKIIVVRELDRVSIYSIFKNIPLGPCYIGTILKNRGHDVEILDEFLTKVNPHELIADIILISSLTNSINRAYKIADIFRKMGIKVIIGGVHASLVSKEAIKHADQVVIGEGESIISDVVEGKIKNKIVKATLIENLDSLPFPDYSIIKDLPKTPRITMLSTSRGCPFDCKFYSVVKMHGRKYRFRSPENVLKELKMRMPIKHRMFFNDDNFIANKERAKKILKGMIKNNLLPKEGWGTQVRVDVAKDKELLELLKKSKCDLLYIGLESINEKTLEEYDKKQKVQDVINCVDTLHKYGIRVFGLIIAGSDNDTIETIKKTVKFAYDYDIEIVQLTAYTPLPGTRLYDELKKDKRLIVKDWDYYDLEHVVYTPKLMTPYTLQKEIFKAFREIYSIKRIFRFLRKGMFNQVLITTYLAIQTRRWQKSQKEYLDYLKKIK